MYKYKHIEDCTCLLMKKLEEIDKDENEVLYSRAQRALDELYSLYRILLLDQ